MNYIREYSFDDCRHINLLFFDFYLPNYNCCIEYDGEQHYKKTKFSHDDFGKRKIRDEIKNKYCDKNKIKLIRIPYWEYNKINEQYLLKKIEE